MRKLRRSEVRTNKLPPDRLLPDFPDSPSPRSCKRARQCPAGSEFFPLFAAALCGCCSYSEVPFGGFLCPADVRCRLCFFLLGLKRGRFTRGSRVCPGSRHPPCCCSCGRLSMPDPSSFRRAQCLMQFGVLPWTAFWAVAQRIRRGPVFGRSLLPDGGFYSSQT